MRAKTVRRIAPVTLAFLMIALGLVPLGIGGQNVAVAAESATPPLSALRYSADAITYTDALPANLWSSLAPLVPGNTQTQKLWVKNISDFPVAFSLSVSATSTEPGWLEELELSTVPSGRQRIAPDQVVQVQVRARLAPGSSNESRQRTALSTIHLQANQISEGPVATQSNAAPAQGGGLFPSGEISFLPDTGIAMYWILIGALGCLAAGMGFTLRTSTKRQLEPWCDERALRSERGKA